MANRATETTAFSVVRSQFFFETGPESGVVV